MKFVKKSFLKLKRAATGVAIFSVTFAPPHAALVATVWGEELTGFARDVISKVHKDWIDDSPSNTNGQVIAASLPTTGNVSMTQPAAAYTAPELNADNFAGVSNNMSSSFMGEHGTENAPNAFISAALSALGSTTTNSNNGNSGFGGGSIPSIGGSGGGQPLTFAPPTKGGTTAPTNGDSTPPSIGGPKEPANGGPTQPTVAGPTEPTGGDPTGPATNNPTEPTNGDPTPPTVAGPAPFVPEIVLPITNPPVDGPPNPTDNGDGTPVAILPVADPQACGVPGAAACNVIIAAVPEPISLALLAVGLAGLGVTRRKPAT